MKKMLAIALAATMTFTMSLSSIADNIKQLGNFVISEDVVTDDNLEEELEDEITDDANYADTNTSNSDIMKTNPSTGAGNLDLVVLSALGIVIAGVLTIGKK